MTNILENLNGIGGIGVGIGLMTIVGQCLGAGQEGRGSLLHQKLCVIAEIVMAASCVIVFALTKPITILGGMEPESAKMCFHGVMWITIVKPLVAGGVICSVLVDLRAAGCKIFYDHILLYNVGMQILPVCISDPCNGTWPDGSMDRKVCGLDGQKYYFHLAIPQQQEMAGA